MRQKLIIDRIILERKRLHKEKHLEAYGQAMHKWFYLLLKQSGEVAESLYLWDLSEVERGLIKCAAIIIYWLECWGVSQR